MKDEKQDELEVEECPDEGLVCGHCLIIKALKQIRDE